MRHFGYQVEQTANALLNTNELPLDLQALMSVELKAENASVIIAGSFVFRDFIGMFIFYSKFVWSFIVAQSSKSNFRMGRMSFGHYLMFLTPFVVN